MDRQIALQKAVMVRDGFRTFEVDTEHEATHASISEAKRAVRARCFPKGLTPKICVTGSKIITTMKSIITARKAAAAETPATT